MIMIVSWDLKRNEEGIHSTAVRRANPEFKDID